MVSAGSRGKLGGNLFLDGTVIDEQLTNLISREPGSTVMIVGSKADGVLVGMDGKYSSMAAGFR